MSMQIEGVAGPSAARGTGAGEKFRGEASRPDQAIADQFSALLNPAPAQPTTVTPEVSGADTPDSCTLGDCILSSLKSAGSDFRESWNQIEALSQSDGSLSLTDAFQVQWHMVTMATQLEAVGKAVGKAAQDVDQLARTQ